MELCVAKNAQGQLQGWTQEKKLAEKVISRSTEHKPQLGSRVLKLSRPLSSL